MRLNAVATYILIRTYICTDNIYIFLSVRPSVCPFSMENENEINKYSFNKNFPIVRLVGFLVKRFINYRNVQQRKGILCDNEE